ncbi:MAG: hypothetical protein KGI27_05170 [Thaumarchaeota archaeon]|nr:hypothetical protein [Nitrososphaerota archaeon]
MMKQGSMIFFLFSLFFIPQLASAYPLSEHAVTEGIFGDLNWQPEPLTSDSEAIGNYEVVLITDPYTPNVNQTTHIQLKVFNYNEGPYGSKSNYASIGVNHFLMGAKIYYNDNLVYEIPEALHEGNSWSFDYVFRESGNHVLKVNLYDVAENDPLETYVFNVPVLTGFGFIFSYLIIAACVAVASVLIWIKISLNRKKKMSR